jgi:repressor LexA
MDLTKRQQEIFDFIRKYSAKYGYPPTVRDIGKAVGLASSSTVHAHLSNLEKVGLLRRDPSKPRAIELLDRAVGTAVDSVRGIVRSDGIPVLGTVAAGAPVLAEENIEDYVSVPAIAGGDEGEYVLRVRGDSMKDAGILEGDMVVVHAQDTAHDGEVVVALLGEEATVKRFYRESDHVRLQPENASMEPIRSKEVRILGRVVGLLRVSEARALNGIAGARYLGVRRSGGRERDLVLEESPDITGQGGREIDPGKPEGKCHRNDTADVRRQPPANGQG